MNAKTKIHYNNHISSRHDHAAIAVKLFNAILEKGDGHEIIMLVDDGDGDTWKYTINVDVEYMDAIQQLKEN